MCTFCPSSLLPLSDAQYGVPYLSLPFEAIIASVSGGLKWEGAPVRKHVIGFLRCWVCLRAPLPVSALEAGSGLNRVAASQSPATQWEHLSYIAQSHLYSLIPGLLGNTAVSCWIFEPNSVSVGEKIVLCVCVVVPMKEAIVPPPQRIEGLTLYIIEPLLFFL